MPDFRYITRDAKGLTQRGTLSASTVEALAAELRGRGLLVVEVEPVRGGGRSGAASGWLPATRFDAETGLQQLATMLHSGLSLLSALRTVAEQARRARAMAVWSDVAERIEQGASFARALAAHPRVFSEHVVQLVRVGESSGNLDAALRSAADHLERARQMRLTVFNALMYPAIVAVMAAGVTGFLVIGVIPKLEKYLGGRGRTLPAITQNLLDAVAWLQHWAPQLGVLAGAAVVALLLVYRWPPGRLLLDRGLLRIPVIGRVLRLAGTATLARSLSVLVESGVTLLDSLRTVAQLLGNRALAARVESARETVLGGGTLATALSGAEFMPMLPRMVAVGESAGTLATVLQEVAAFHEAQLVAAIRRMSLLIEPVVILLVGGIVGFVYIAFFVALFSLTGSAR
jgi:type II secretory pathway component PulF